MSAYINTSYITSGTPNFITRQEVIEVLQSLSSLNLSSFNTFATPNPRFSTIAMPPSGSISAPGSIQATEYNVSTTSQIITSRQNTNGLMLTGLQNSAGTANSYLECAGIQTAALPGTAGAGQQGLGFLFNGINGVTAANVAVPLVSFNGTNFAMSNIASLNTTTGGSINASVGNISTLNANTFSTSSLAVGSLSTSNINVSTLTATSRLSTTSLFAGSVNTPSFTSGSLSASNVSITLNPNNYALALQTQPYGATIPSLAVAYNGGNGGLLEINRAIVTGQIGQAGALSPAMSFTSSSMAFLQSGSGTQYPVLTYNGTTGAALSNISSLNGASITSVPSWIDYTVTNTASQAVALSTTFQNVLTFSNIPITAAVNRAVYISVPISINSGGTPVSGNFPVNIRAFIGGNQTAGTSVNAQYTFINGGNGGIMTLSGVCIVNGTTNTLVIQACVDSPFTPTITFTQGSGSSASFFFLQVV